MTPLLDPPWLVVVDMQEIFSRTDSGWAVPRIAPRVHGSTTTAAGPSHCSIRTTRSMR